MASHADPCFLVASQAGVHKIHFKRVNECRSSFIRSGSTLSSQGIDSGPAGLYRIRQITRYAGLGDIAFNRSNLTVISQHNLVFACSEGFSRSFWEMADFGSSDYRRKPVRMDIYFSCNKLAHSEHVR